MNVVYLKYAIAVAKAGSFNKAAEELFVAQPNLTRAVKELEKELEIIIFERTSHGVLLTNDGEKLIERGKRILKLIEETEYDLKGGGKNGKKLFSLSAPRASYISHAFSEFTKELSEEKKCEAYYKETNASTTISDVLSQEFHLGIVRYASVYDKYFKDLFESKNLSFELVSELKYMLLVSKNSHLAKSGARYSDLENYTEIAYADHYAPSISVSDILKEELSEKADRRVFVYDRASRFEILSSNASAFMWVSPIPEDVLEKYGLVQLNCPDNTKIHKDVLIYPKSYKLTSLDKAFITYLCNSKREFLK